MFQILKVATKETSTDSIVDDCEFLSWPTHLDRLAINAIVDDCEFLSWPMQLKIDFQ